MSTPRHPAQRPPRANLRARPARAPMEPLERRVLMAAGYLDAGFDGDGRLVAAAGTGGAVVVQADGKVVTAGATEGPGALDFLLRRYNPDGSPDATFGVGGTVTTDFGGRSDAARAVALQSDGKIVIAGSSGREFAVARYHPSGTPDLSFSGDGIATTSFGFSGAALDVVVQSDGKIVAAGSGSTLPGESTFALARYNADGSLDTTFGAGGTVTTAHGLTAAYAVAIGPGGKIVAGGTADTYLGDSALARYNADGSLDASFGPFPEHGDDLPPPGIVRSAFEGYNEYDEIHDVAVDADGSIVAAGHFAGRGFVVTRFADDGLFYDRFDPVQFPGTVSTLGSAATAVALAPGGQILAAGYTASPAGEPENFALVRFNGDGVVDQTFGFRGVAVTDFRAGPPGATGPDPRDAATGVALAPGGAVVVAGSSDGRGALARYLGTGDAAPAPVNVTAANTLAVDGTAGSDDVRLYPWADVIPRFVADLNGSLFLSPLGVGRVAVNGFAGDDVIRAVGAMNFPMELDGGAGRDRLTGGNGGDVLRGGSGTDMLNGNGGSDTIDGGLGSDVVFGGDGDDLMLATETGGPAAGDYYSGGNGADTVDYSGRVARLVIRLGLYASSGRERDTLRSDVENAVGGAGNDRIEGNDLANILLGGAGNDVLVGRGGNDILIGAQGDDVLTDRVGTNTLDGGPGIDTINGVREPGADVVLEAENATLSGASVSRTHAGYTGTGYADFGSARGYSIDWAFDNGAGAGPRTLTFRYANGGSANRPLELRVNGQVVLPSMAFLPSGNWSVWRTVSVTVTLAAGVNHIRLTSIETRGPNVDSLTIGT